MTPAMFHAQRVRMTESERAAVREISNGCAAMVGCPVCGVGVAQVCKLEYGRIGVHRERVAFAALRYEKP